MSVAESSFLRAGRCFTSSCSPRRIAAAQLLLVSKPEHRPVEDLGCTPHLQFVCARRRTGNPTFVGFEKRARRPTKWRSESLVREAKPGRDVGSRNRCLQACFAR